MDGSVDRRERRGVESLYDDLEDHLPTLRKINLAFRRGGRSGRYRQARNEFIVTDDERDADFLQQQIITMAEELEDRHGECVFRTILYIEVDGVIKQTPPCVWGLHDAVMTTEAAAEAMTLIRAQGRALHLRDGTISRQFGDLEKLVGTISTLAERVATAHGQGAEVLRIQYDHEAKMAHEKAEEHRADRELDLIGSIAPKALAVMGAREARKEAAERNQGDKKSAWRHVIQIAGVIVQRPAVREVLGERGTDIVESIAASRTRDEVEQCVAELRQMGEKGEINMFHVLAVAPEVMPLLDLLVA